MPVDSSVHLGSRAGQFLGVPGQDREQGWIVGSFSLSLTGRPLNFKSFPGQLPSGFQAKWSPRDWELQDWMNRLRRAALSTPWLWLGGPASQPGWLSRQWKMHLL